jgi:hypothetical protein
MYIPTYVHTFASKTAYIYTYMPTYVKHSTYPEFSHVTIGCGM